ncbi:MAG TPA: HAD family acid phosphatase, partial [Candidatus Obscuribacterales bacterium]
VPANVVIKESDRRSGFLFTFTRDYHRQVRQAIEDARAVCMKHIGKPGVAVVSDIDETLLDNRGQFYRDRKDWTWAKFKAWQNESRASALEPTRRFLAWARKNGFAIFLVTGRFESQRAATIVNLVKCGIAYDGLYMRRDQDKDLTAAQVKPPLRKAIEDLGFKIVVNIGDQWSDLVGGHAEECIKLPNKLYFVE